MADGRCKEEVEEKKAGRKRLEEARPVEWTEITTKPLDSTYKCVLASHEYVCWSYDEQ